MVLYSAGTTEIAGPSAAGSRAVLLSYGLMTEERLSRELKAAAAVPGMRVFLDSGAFSAKNKGTVIDLQDYCRFVRAHLGLLAEYAALDVIGDPAGTLANWDKMREAGLDPLATYHYGSPVDRLAVLLERKPRAMAVGGMVLGRWRQGVLEARDARKAWLDATFRGLRAAWPVPVHLFGTLTQWILERYPFYSADSTSALIGAAFGNVNEFRGGKYLMDREACNWRQRRMQTPEPCGADGSGAPDAHGTRLAANMSALVKYERYLTDMWAARGVMWGAN